MKTAVIPTRVERFGLTQRQTQILHCLALGSTRKEAALHLKLSVKTVEYHIAEMCKALGIVGDVNLVRFAVENNMVNKGDVMPEKMPTVQAPEYLNPNQSDIPDFRTTGDLAQALMRAAALASVGLANVLQVTALCQCTNSIIDLARLQIEVGDKMTAPWLSSKTTPKRLANGANGNGKNGH